MIEVCKPVWSRVSAGCSRRLLMQLSGALQWLRHAVSAVRVLSCSYCASFTLKSP